MQQAEQRHAVLRRTGAAVAGVATVLVAVLVGGVAVFGSPAKPTPPPVAAGIVPSNKVGKAKPLTSLAEKPAAASAAPADAAVSAPAATPAEAAKPASAAAARAPKAVAPQHIRLAIGATGYEPSALQASSLSAITLTVGKGEGCAAGFLMPSLGISKDNSRGSVTFSLGKLKPGTYRFSCAMEMVEGRLIVR